MAVNERIQITVSETGSRTVRRNLEEIGTSARTAASGVGLLQAALAALTFRGAANIIDSYTRMQNKIATVTKSQAELKAVTERLYEVSRNSYQGINTITDAYFRFNGALEKMGYSQNQVIDLTETISKAFAVAGASADETERAMVQLAQGFSKNKLQTQDLKAAMEQAPYVIQVLAKNLDIAGYSAQQAEFALYELAEQGKLTGEAMFKAFMQARKEIEEKFAKTMPTIEQGWNMLTQAFNRWIGAAANGNGTASMLSRGLLTLADNFESLAGYISAALAGVLAWGAARALITGLTVLVGGFGLSFAGVIGLAAAAAAAVYSFGGNVKLAGAETLTLRGLMTQTWESGKQVVSEWAQNIQAKLPAVGTLMKKVFSTDIDLSLKNVLKNAYEVAQKLGVYFTAAAQTFVDSWREIPGALYDIIVMAMNKVTQMVAQGLNTIYNSVTGFVNKLIGTQFEELRLGGMDAKVTGAAQRIAGKFVENVNKGMAELAPAGQVIDDFYKKAETNEANYIAQQKAGLAELEAARKGLDAARPDRRPEISGELQGYLDNLEKEKAALSLVNDEYRIRQALIQFEKQNNVELVGQQRALFESSTAELLQMQRKHDLLEEIKQPYTDLQYGMQALNQLAADGSITMGEYNAKLDEMKLRYLEALPAAQTFTEGLGRQMEIMQLQTKNSMGILGTEIGKIFGPGGSLVNGVADAVAQSVVFGKSWKDQIRQVAQSILSQLISAIVKMGLNMVMNQALNAAMGAASTAQGVAQAGALTAAYTPAAAMASLATGGTNAAAAGAGISSVFSILTSLVGSIGMFKEGGYTGPVGTNQVAGIVHGQEFVVNAQATRKHRATLEALNAGRDLGTQVVAPPPAPVSVNITNEIPDAAFEARALNESEVEIIARRVVRREAPEVFASDIRNPNSRSAKAISSNTMATRRR